MTAPGGVDSHSHMASSTPVPPPAAGGRPPLFIWIAIAGVIVLAALLVRALNNAPAPQDAASATASSSASTSSVAPPAAAPAPQAAAPAAPAAKKTPASGPLPPLPMLGFAPPRPIETVRAVFEFAARRPDVLEYVPCFCGCENSGHRGNDDCFVKRREPNGDVEWEPHGMS